MTNPEFLDLHLLARMATGEGGRRTGALRRAGLLRWGVTRKGKMLLAELKRRRLSQFATERAHIIDTSYSFMTMIGLCGCVSGTWRIHYLGHPDFFFLSPLMIVECGYCGATWMEPE